MTNDVFEEFVTKITFEEWAKIRIQCAKNLHKLFVDMKSNWEKENKKRARLTAKKA